MIPPPITTYGRYKWYVLGVLLLVFTLNFIDRQIIAVLAPYIKEDWQIGDAQIGLLYGTGFAVFYSIFGIPLAKFADLRSRKWTLCVGLATWSAATAVSGLTTTFGQLLLARLVVGIAESSSQPAAVSMLSDYFPLELRSTALGIYMFGMYVGSGCSLIVGGAVVDAWQGTESISGWQVAFFVVGIPGIIVAAILAFTVREPERRIATCSTARDSAASAGVAAEFIALIVPWRSATTREARISLRRASTARLVAVLIFAGVAATVEMRLMSGSTIGIGPFQAHTAIIQWAILGIGILLALNWTAALSIRSPLAHRLLVRGRAFRLIILSGGLLSVFTYSIGAFAFTYGTNYVGLTAADGRVLGFVSIAAGGIGMIAGGGAADFARRRNPAGRLTIVMIAIVLFSFLAVLQFTATDKLMFYAASFFTLMLLTCWPPILMATGQDLVTSEIRGTAVAYQTLATALVGLGLGPYLVGLISATFGSLRAAILCTLLLVPVVIFLLYRCARQLPIDEHEVQNSY